MTVTSEQYYQQSPLWAHLIVFRCLCLSSRFLIQATWIKKQRTWKKSPPLPLSLSRLRPLRPLRGGCGSGGEPASCYRKVTGSIALVCMLKCPGARYWTPNCSWCTGRHLAWHFGQKHLLNALKLDQQNLCLRDCWPNCCGSWWADSMWWHFTTHCGHSNKHWCGGQITALLLLVFSYWLWSVRDNQLKRSECHVIDWEHYRQQCFSTVGPKFLLSGTSWGGPVCHTRDWKWWTRHCKGFRRSCLSHKSKKDRIKDGISSRRTRCPWGCVIPHPINFISFELILCFLSFILSLIWKHWNPCMSNYLHLTFYLRVM